MKLRMSIVLISLTAILLAGCLEEESSEEDPDGVIEEFFSLMDEGEYEQAMDLFHYQDGTPYDLDEGEISDLEGVYGINGENVTFEIVEMEKEREWKDYDPECEMVEYRVVINLITGNLTEEIDEYFIVGHFIDDDQWALIMDYEEDEGHEVEVMNIRARAYTESDSIVIEVISGTIDWSDYDLRVDGVSFDTESTVTMAGDEVIFEDPASGTDMIPGEEYNIKIINMMENKVVFEDDVIGVVE